MRRGGSDDDGRAVRVSLTPAGKRLARTLTREIGSRLEPMMQRLGASDQRRLAALLGALLPE